MSDLASFANMLELLKDPKEMERRFGEMTRKQKELEALQKEINQSREAAEKASAAAKKDREASDLTIRDSTKARAEAVEARDKAERLNSELDAKRSRNEQDSEKISRQYADLAAKQKVLEEKDATLTALSNELHLRKQALDNWVQAYPGSAGGLLNAAP